MRVLFKQIAATRDGYGNETVFGLTQNGFVYYYSQVDENWKPLPMEAETGTVASLGTNDLVRLRMFLSILAERVQGVAGIQTSEMIAMVEKYTGNDRDVAPSSTIP